MLSVLLAGSASSGVDSERRVREFLGLARLQDLDLGNLWGGFRGGEPRVAVLLVPSAGRTAMGFVGPLRDASLVEPVGRLLRAACDGQDAGRTRLVQSLLDPSQTLEEAALAHAGFERLAELIYMRRETAAKVPGGALGAGVQLLPWVASRRGLFVEAIRGSYEQTLDCPGLVGVRDMDDIIAGHMGAGRFVPDLWHVLMEGGEPAGVMLINLVGGGGVCELVYFGLRPSARGRGIALGLLNYGLEAAHAHRARQMVLAVDRDNIPAIRLYERAGFLSEARKVAMITTLG